MPIYVDDAFLPFGRMLMCHLTSETVDELQTFAVRLGLKPEWFQDHRVPHFDISKGIREKAIILGAIPVAFGAEPWRCDDCFRPTLPCVKRLRCSCPERVRAAEVDRHLPEPVAVDVD